MVALQRYHWLFFLIVLAFGGTINGQQAFIQDVQGRHPVDSDRMWLSHEHVLVDFIGADSIQFHTWDHDAVIAEVMPFLEEIKAYEVDYFVDATRPTWDVMFYFLKK